jgi:hypothetical protein
LGGGSGVSSKRRLRLYSSRDTKTILIDDLRLPIANWENRSGGDF